MSGFFTNAFRLLRMGRILARHDALFLIDLAPDVSPALKVLNTMAGMLARKEKTDLRPGERLALAMQEMGPSHIKMGQFFATRPDVIGEEIATDLSKLQDRLPPFGDEQARVMIEKSLGAPIDDLFEEFGPPIAAASIAQVHFAITREKNGIEGKAVAVKILRPGIHKAFERDLETFDWVADMLTAVNPKVRRLRPHDVVQNLRDSVELELDLRLEAAAASELAENTRNDKGYRVPEVDWQRTAQDVLTTERIDAFKAHDRQALLDAGLDVKDVANRIIQSFLRQALRDGFFHADLHPGNLFIDSEGTLIPIDFGIMGRIDKDTRRFLAEILFGFLTRDYAQVAKSHFDAGYVPPGKSQETFAQALRSIGEPIFGLSAEDVSMGRLLAQLFQVTETFQMETQPQLILLQKTMVVVEGVARSLDPDHNIWEASEPILRDWVETNLGPEAIIRDAAEGAGALARSLPHLPQLMERMEDAAERLTDPDGVKLHPDTLKSMSGTRSSKLPLIMAITALAIVTALLAERFF